MTADRSVGCGSVDKVMSSLTKILNLVQKCNYPCLAFLQMSDSVNPPSNK